MSVTIREPRPSPSVESVELDGLWDKIGIDHWLKTLPDNQYQRCTPGNHKAAGA